ncbi:MAG: hypothetical protein QXK47_05625 [Candidatus Bathyarchaeia archaeon]
MDVEEEIKMLEECKEALTKKLRLCDWGGLDGEAIMPSLLGV